MVMGPHPFDDDGQRRIHRLESQLELDSDRRRRLILLAGGALALIAFGALAMLGLPGSGVVLVPIGMGMILGGGIPMLLDQLSRL